MCTVYFRYNPGYDKRFRTHQEIIARLKDEGKEYPSPDKIRTFLNEIKPLWRKIESKVLEEISNATGLSWQEDNIKCYLIGFGTSFSDPLTISILKTKERFIDLLVHEMAHQIYIQNYTKVGKWWELMNAKYPDDSLSAKIHVFVHAVYAHVYLSIFDEKRLQEDIDLAQSPKAKDYKRAWEIVQQEGHEKILKEFKNLTA